MNPIDVLGLHIRAERISCRGSALFTRLGSLGRFLEVLVREILLRASLLFPARSFSGPPRGPRTSKEAGIHVQAQNQMIAIQIPGNLTILQDRGEVSGHLGT